MSPLSTVSVDLDSLQFYCRIHGLSESVLSDRARRLVAEVAIPRCLELFQAAGVDATFFVIGQDLDADLTTALDLAHRSGVELASHGWAHDYAMSRWTFPQVIEDLRKAHEAITLIAGAPPVGFRAPGYSLSAAMANALEELHYRYDSSAFPALPYYLAKAGVLAAQRLLGMHSHSQLDRPTVLLAPRGAYRPSRQDPYRRGDLNFLELPVAVERRTRLPFIGTLVVSAPWPVVDVAWRSLGQDRVVNFELHAIDVLDVSDGVPAEVAARQPEGRVPARQKLERLAKVLARLKWGREVVTMAEAARRLESDHG